MMITRAPTKKALGMNYIQMQRFPSWFLLLNSALLNSLFNKFRIILMMFLVTGLISCSQITETAIKLNLNVSRIDKIQRKGKIDNQVYLKGTVESRAPFIETGAYELADNTGSIWIFTTGELPNIGTEITIKGKIRYQSIVVPELGNKDVGDFYIEEIERIEEENYEQQ
ncbi:MAG: DNA-binding protein [Cyanobacteria bacterium P01_H01_bin.35]